MRTHTYICRQNSIVGKQNNEAKKKSWIVFGLLLKISWSTRGRRDASLSSQLCQTSQHCISAVAAAERNKAERERESSAAAADAAVTLQQSQVKFVWRNEFIIAATFKTWRCFVPLRKTNFVLQNKKRSNYVNIDCKMNYLLMPKSS